MALLPCTAKIISEVEELSGRKVVVEEDPSLATLATVQIARGAVPFHLVRYRPGGVQAGSGAGADTSGDTTNYLIVYQLGFLIRLFSRSIGERWQIAATTEEKAQGIDGLGLTDLPGELAPGLFDQLITQLRTYPIGMRVDGWILQECPELRAEQAISAQMQLAAGEQALAPSIRERFPKAIVDANSSMNAAFAKFWSEHLDEPRYVVPYSALGYGEIADRLCGVLADLADEPEADRPLLESWARMLGLTDYFHFETHTFDV